MGPIQTALSKAASLVSGAAVGIKKFDEVKGQALQEKGIKEAEKTEIKETVEEAPESLIIPEEAYREAQEKGLESPRRIIFDKAGRPLATYEETAQLLANNSLNASLSSKKLSKNSIEERRKYLENKGGNK